MSSQLEISAAQATLNAVGARGSQAITGTSIVNAPAGSYFYCIQFVTDGTVTAQGNATDSMGSVAVNATLSALGTFPAGFVIYGKFSSITLGSGSAIGYIARG